MAVERRRTPCIGICSTTYGDLICRGCRRFSHEIVEWNGYSEDQRERVWQRLIRLRDASLAALVEITDLQRLRVAAAGLRLEADLSPLSLAYELLRRRGREIDSLAAVGLRALCSDIHDGRALRDAVDAEFHRRSVAAYEHSFHVSVDG